MVLYSVCLVVLPFFAFEGGFVANVQSFITNLNLFSTQPYRFDYWGGTYTNFYSYGVSLQNFIRVIYCKITDTSMLETSTAVEAAALAVTFLFMFLLVFAAMVTKSKWKHVMALSLILVLFPDPSYVYSMIFFFIPLTMFLLDGKKKTNGDIAYLILFILLFSPVQTGYFILQYFNGLQYGYTWSNFLEVVFMLVFTVALFAESLRSLVREKDKEKAICFESASCGEPENKAFLPALLTCFVRLLQSWQNRFAAFRGRRKEKRQQKRAALSADGLVCLRYKRAMIVNTLLVAAVVVIGIYVCGLLFGSVDNAFAYFYSFAMSDYGQVIHFAMADNPYVGDFTTSYTPINFLFFKLFAAICSCNDAFYTSLTFDDLTTYNRAILMTPHFWGTFVVYIVLCVVAMYFILRGMSGMDKKKFFFFFGALTFSNFLIYGISRGSNILIAFIFVAFFLRFYHSEKRWQRELSYIALAVAGAMKFYPLFFGIYLLRDKNKRAVVKVALYTVFLIFFPFVFVQGGFANIPTFIANFFFFTGGEDRLTGSTNISAISIFAKFFALFGDGQAVTVLTAIFKWLSVFAVFGFGLYGAMKTKNNFSLSVIVMCVVTLVPVISYFYLIIFAVFPLLQFVNCQREMPRYKRYYYLAFFLFNGFIFLVALTDYTVIALFYLVTFVFELVHVFRENGKKSAKPRPIRGRAGRRIFGRSSKHV